MAKKFYITTTLPYVNAEPHIGFALEMVQADVLARYWKLQDADIVFNTGTDEHGLKIYQKAVEEGKNPQKYCDEYAAKFENLKKALNLSYTHFIRTTDKHHLEAAQEFWRRCQKNGYIYRKHYKVKYCIGCELEKTESELINNRCPLHPEQQLEIIEEENYFFKFSSFQKKLLKLYDENLEFVVPSFRLKEIRNFVAKGLEDFSISRLKSKMPWGVDVPDDSKHVMYVWFDALVNYISTLGWPNDEKKFKEFWPGIQIAGKDNLRQQSAMWQAMLMAAELPTSKQIMIHGFITSDGKKMSKSLRNVVDPYELVKKYGVDAVRYYLLREIPPFEDGDYSDIRMQEVYDADLANELGNLVSRITNLGEEDGIDGDTIGKTPEKNTKERLDKLIESYQFSEALNYIWALVKQLNKKLDEYAPWKKTKDVRGNFLKQTLNDIYNVGSFLRPFLPETAEKIMNAASGKIRKVAPLFPRI